MSRIILLDGVDADTNGEAFPTYGSDQTLVIQAASYGGGTVNIEISRDSGASWVPLTINGVIATFNSDGAYLVNRISAHYLVRATLTSSTSPSNVFVELAD